MARVLLYAFGEVIGSSDETLLKNAPLFIDIRGVRFSKFGRDSIHYCSYIPSRRQ